MSISQKTKESIADALAVAIQDAAVAASCNCAGNPTHYEVSIGKNGHVQLQLLTRDSSAPPDEGWIPIDE